MINDAKTIKANNPELLATLLGGIFLGEGVDKRTYNAVFDQAIKHEPTFYNYYFKKALFLQPRWHGDEGEWQAFAKSMADKLGGEEGDILYARIIWSVNYLTANILKEPYVNKDRVLRGFRLLEKRYPESLWVLSAECLMNIKADSTSVAILLMEKLKNRVDIKVWKTVDYFDKTQKWLIELKHYNQTYKIPKD